MTKILLYLISSRQAVVFKWILLERLSKKITNNYLDKNYLTFLNYKHGKILGNITAEKRVAARAWVRNFFCLVLLISYSGIPFVTHSRIALFQLAAIFVLALVTWELKHRLISRIGRDIFKVLKLAEANATLNLSALRKLEPLRKRMKRRSMRFRTKLV